MKHKKKPHQKTKHKSKHPHDKKIPYKKNFRAMWVIGVIIFLIGIIIDNIWITIPGGMLAIYGVMNRHHWHLHHIK